MTLDESVEFVIEHLRLSNSSDQTFRAYERTLNRFGEFARASGAESVADFTTELVSVFVNAIGKHGEQPAIGTRHGRRNALRLFAGVLTEFGLLNRRDPTATIELPPRTLLSIRPLTDDEMNLCQWASLNTLIETRLPATLALAEATAVTSEAAAITAADIDLTGGTVRLPGCKTAGARTGQLSPWGLQQIRRRVNALNGATGPIVYGGTASPESAQATTADALLKIIATAGLGQEPDVGVGSIRARTGLAAYRNRYRIEDAARVLGCRSLDVAARIVGMDWRDETPP